VIIVLGDAQLTIELQTLEILLHDEVDHAPDGVRAIHC